MEEAKAIAVAGYQQFLDDGPEVCSSESEAESRDHGEQWLASGPYTPDTLYENGNPILGRATMTTAQANLLRNQGMAGGQDTALGYGQSDSRRKCLNDCDTYTRTPSSSGSTVRT
jgi:hypothetical protein